VTARIKEEYEFIFIDDGSQDSSVAIIQQLISKDARVKLIEFSRNFGKEVAITAGVNSAIGDAAIMIDADLQHPVELIPEFIARWRAGADVVVGVRESYGNESVFKKFSSWLFYKIFNAIAVIGVTPHATDYRLIDRVVIDEFNRFSERNRIARGLIDWLGFRRDYIYFQCVDRANGKAAYGFTKLVRLAINSFVGLSLFPLRLAGWLGIVITTLAGTFLLFVIVERVILSDPLSLYISGTAILAGLSLLMIGVVLISLGLIALYIENIHNEVINRPLYVVRPPRVTAFKEERERRVATSGQPGKRMTAK
jgi:dolichol-phosphate mannosyltransferase